MGLLLKCIVWLGILGMILVGYLFGQTIPFAQQWPLFEALRATASIIFAVVGAWLAIIYPERLKFTFKEPTPGTEDKEAPSVNMGKLLHPAIHSTMILCIILLVGIIAPLMKQFIFLLPYKPVMRGLSYGLLVILTFWQLWTVILTLVPADMIKTKSDMENKKRKTTAEFFSRAQKHNDDKGGGTPK